MGQWWTHLGEGNHGAIIEDGEQHDEDGGEVEVVQHRQQPEGEADAEGHGDGVPAMQFRGGSALAQKAIHLGHIFCSQATQFVHV